SAGTSPSVTSKPTRPPAPSACAERCRGKWRSSSVRSAAGALTGGLLLLAKESLRQCAHRQHETLLAGGPFPAMLHLASTGSQCFRGTPCSIESRGEFLFLTPRGAPALAAP